MNKYKLIQIISWVIVFVVFLGLALWFLLGNNKVRMNRVFGTESLSGPYEEEGRYLIETAGMDSLEFIWTAGKVTVIPYDSHEILLVEYAQRSLEEDEKLVYEKNGGTLTVRFCEKKVRQRDSMPAKRLEVFLPKELTVALSDFTLECVSADVDVKQLSAKSLNVRTVSGVGNLSDMDANRGEIKSTSGNMILSNIRISKLSVSTVSGEIEAERMETEELTAHSTSGSMRLSEVEAKQLQFDTVSGDISFLGSCQELQANSTSGEMKITNQVAPEGFQMKSVSGRIQLTMPSFENFSLYQKTVSGSFDCEIPVVTQKENNAKYTIITTSGDIDIRKLN